MNQLKEMLEAYRNGERGLPTYDELAEIAMPAGDCELPTLPDTTYNAYSDGSEPLWTKEQMEYMWQLGRASAHVFPEKSFAKVG